CVGQRLQRTDPDARSRTDPSNVAGEPRHVRELLVATIPGTNAGLVLASNRLPPVVNHRERTIRAWRRQIDNVLGVDKNRRGAVLSVDPVPIVAAVDGLRRQTRALAHHTGEGVNRREGGLAIAARSAHHVADAENAFAQLHAGAAATHVRRESDALRIDLPGAERLRPCANTVRVRERSVVGRHVPGHDAVRHPSPPLEIAVATFPCVADDEASGGEIAAPAKTNTSYSRTWRGQFDPQRPR